MVTWRYGDTPINNGSTLVDDVDMRSYFYVERTIEGGETKKSELFLSATTVDDNGTFVCRAENKAGAAAARFTLHVVVPMPPKPPQVKKRDRESKKVASHFPPYYRRVLLRLSCAHRDRGRVWTEFQFKD